MYLRVKKRKNKKSVTLSYLYLVESRHRKRSKFPKQKTIAYLGRVVNKKALQTTKKPLNLAGESFKSGMMMAIKNTLKSTEFTYKEGLFQNKDITIDLEKKAVKAKESSKDICAALNHGFLCGYTLRRLLNFRMPKSTEKEVGKYLAKCLVEAGIAVNDEEFIYLFNHLKAQMKQPNNTKQ